MKRRRLSNQELRQLARTYCGMSADRFDEAVADEVMIDDDEVRSVPWPYWAKLKLILSVADCGTRPH